MKGIDGMVNAIYEENDELLVEKIIYVARGHYRRGIKSRVEFEVRLIILFRTPLKIDNQYSCLSPHLLGCFPFFH